MKGASLISTSWMSLLYEVKRERFILYPSLPLLPPRAKVRLYCELVRREH